MPFEPIETQEDFDSAIRARLAREREKFADYDETKAALEESMAEVARLTEEARAAEELRAAADYGF